MDDTDLTADVLATTEAYLLCESDEPRVVKHLIDRGYSELRAELLMVLVPIGLARAVIKRLPRTAPIHLQAEVLIRMPDGSDLEVGLFSVPEFVAALELGEATFETGVIPREELQASTYSVELKNLNQMLNAGVDISGAVCSRSILLRLGEVPGFDEWYRSHASSKRNFLAKLSGWFRREK
jgi:hypothetical protein